MSSVLAALELAGRGLPIFPARAKGRPIVKWLDDASSDPQTITDWWFFHKDPMIGLPLPVGTLAVDIDDPIGFVDSGLELPATSSQATPRGGSHHFYRTDGRLVRQTVRQLHPSLDTRVGGKGYVIAYEPDAITASSEWALAPDWVYEARMRPAAPVAAGLDDDEAIPPGRRHDHYVRLAGRLKNVGLGHDAILAALRAENARRSPDHDDQDLALIARSSADWDGSSSRDTSESVGSDGETREAVVIPPPGWPTPLTPAAYHGVAGILVNAIAPYTEADPVGLLGTFLSIFGTLAGDGWSLHQGDWQHTNLFVALVGDTSSGRKGTAFGAIREVYGLVDPNWISVLVPGLGSGEGLIEFLKVHAADPRALVFETEFGRLLTAMTREGSTLSPIIRNAWDGVPIGRYVASQKKSGTVSEHHVGILANITNVELAQKLTSVDAANGFGNRFLWLAVKRPHLLPFTEPVTGHVSPFMGNLRRALDFANVGGFMKLGPEARERWEAFYLDRPARGGLISALTGRAEPYVARLAMVYALLDLTSVIGVDHLMAAEAVWEYAERSAVYIFGDSTGDRNADALLKMLHEQSPVEWLLASKTLGLYRAADMEGVVSMLERMGRVRIVKVTRSRTDRGGPGRPRREIELVI